MSQQRVSVPLDVKKVKTKLFLGLTKRQIVCFGLGVALALPTFIAVRKFLPVDFASIVMVSVAMPFFVASSYTKNGMPLERIFYNYIKWKYIFPKTRLKGGAKDGKKTKSKQSKKQN